MLCACALFGVFSVNASAASNTDESPYFHIQTVVKHWAWGSYQQTIGTTVWYPWDTNRGSTYWDFDRTLTNSANGYRGDLLIQHTLATDDRTYFVPAGDTVTITIQNIPFYAELENSYYQDDGGHATIYEMEYEGICLYTLNGDCYYPDSYSLTFDSSYKYHTLTFSFTAEEPIYKIGLNFYVPVNDYINPDKLLTGMIDATAPQYTGSNKLWLLSIDTEPKELGFLESIAAWLSSIVDWFESLFDMVANWFQAIEDWLIDIIDSINQVAENIWNFIENGFYNLFVPDDDEVTEFKDDMDYLMSTKFGAVYQIGGVIRDFGEGIQTSDEQNSIYFPVVSYDFGGAEFGFGGVDVKIVPDGFDWLATSVKLVTGIVCTLLFLNGLRKRYDDVFGGDHSDAD